MIKHELMIDLGGGEEVSAVITGPDSSADLQETGLILAHGASNDMYNPLIVAVAEGLAEAGFAGLRFNFFYKEKGKKYPDSQTKLEHTWLCAWEAMQSREYFPTKRIVAVGKSMGGRVASQLAAAERLPAAALIFLGYPLHAPGKPDQLRAEHLYAIRAPLLFFAGTRDPFCNLDRLGGVLKRLQCPWDLERIEGGNHSFALPKTADRSAADIQTLIVQKCLCWLQQHDW
jgi:hypothetical protein